MRRGRHEQSGALKRVSALAAFAALACAPALPDTPWLVGEPRILAVQLDPPEAAPGTDVAARVLVASTDGTVGDAAVDWAFCRTPKPPAENRTVNEQCFGDGAEPAGAGPSVYLALPPDGCALFGPETPPGDFRPRDPDSTGGYYQPIRAQFQGHTAITLARISCNLRSAPTDVALELKARYLKNTNPLIRSVDARVDGSLLPLDQIPTGSDVQFSVHWSPEDEERYVLYDTASRNLVGATEALDVAWYTTGSAPTSSHSVGEATARSAETTWRAPSGPGTVHFWAVLRDSRGGSDFTAWDAIIVDR
jgi:hypothetical protein